MPVKTAVNTAPNCGRITDAKEVIIKAINLNPVSRVPVMLNPASVVNKPVTVGMTVIYWASMKSTGPIAAAKIAKTRAVFCTGVGN